MNDSIEMSPVTKPVRGTVRPPGSKSITNRALVCAALADGESSLVGALDSEDTRVMVESLRRLGIELEAQEGGKPIKVKGCGGRIPAADADLYIANSGTSVRFLTALAALGHGRFRLEGTERMHQRPIADLLEGLAELGVALNSEAGNGCPPVVVHGAGIEGGRAVIAGDISSQFLSALLMVGPYAKKPVEVFVEGDLVSQPYVRMTLAVMRAFGMDVAEGDLRRFDIPQGHYRGREYAIEPDASAASYFFAAAAITGGEVTIEGLSRDALQGDVAFVDVLERMGCSVRVQGSGFSIQKAEGGGKVEGGARRPHPGYLPKGEGDSGGALPKGEGAGNSITVAGPRDGKLRGIEVNMNAISDTVQTLAAVALFAEGATTITGAGHIRHKETDRIGNLAIELRKFGARVDELPDGLRIVPPAEPQAARVATYNDHRMAMSLALVGLRVPGVIIEDPKCTEKTYPAFFADLQRLVGKSGR